MPLTGFVGTTKKFQLTNLAFNGTAITSIDTNAGDSILLELLDASGIIYASKTTLNGLTHQGSGTWMTLINLPTVAGALRVHWTVLYQGSEEKFTDKVTAKAVT